MNTELIEPIIVTIRWLLIGIWTLVVAFISQTDNDEWWTLFAIVGGAIIVVAIFVLFLFSIESLTV